MPLFFVSVFLPFIFCAAVWPTVHLGKQCDFNKLGPQIVLKMTLLILLQFMPLWKPRALKGRKQAVSIRRQVAEPPHYTPCSAQCDPFGEKACEAMLCHSQFTTEQPPGPSCCSLHSLIYRCLTWASVECGVPNSKEIAPKIRFITPLRVSVW